VLVWLCVWNKVQIVCIWSSWCHCYPKTLSSLASFKSRLALPFWFWLTKVVLEKRPLNGCSSLCWYVPHTSSETLRSNRSWWQTEVHIQYHTQTHTHPINGPFSGTTQVSRYQKGTRSSAITEGLRDASCQLKSCQLPRNSVETTCTTSPEQIKVTKLEG